MKRFDVIVVGAGPAGATAATLLADQGFDVAMLDRASFPRPKPCGEFVNPGACRLIKAAFNLSTNDLVDAGGARIAKVRLRLARGPDLRVPLGPRAPFGVSIPRMTLDELLLRKCKENGVRVFEDHAVRSFRSDSRRVTVTGSDFEMDGKLLIAADGVHSVLARRAGLLVREPKRESIGLVAHFSRVAPGNGNPDVWMFPSCGDGMMFGLSRQGCSTAVLSASVPKRFGREIAKDPAAFVVDWVCRHPPIESELGGAVLRDVRTTACFGHRLRRSFANRTLFLGDAARFVDPFTGEGIHHAVESAFLAARVTEAAFRVGDFTERTLNSYEDIRGELSRRYSLCNLVRMICGSPRLTEFFGAKLKRKPELAQTLIATLSDLHPANAVLSAPFMLRMLAA